VKIAPHRNVPQVFSDDNQTLERGDSHSSTSLLDSPLNRPLLASSAARQVPLRPLDDDEDEDIECAEALVRSFHSYGQSRSGISSSAGHGTNAMARVGSAPSQIGMDTPFTQTFLDGFEQPIGHGLHRTAGVLASTLRFCVLHRRRRSPWTAKGVALLHLLLFWKNASPLGWTTLIFFTSSDRFILLFTTVCDMLMSSQ
jgi:hypothetical protein